MDQDDDLLTQEERRDRVRTRPTPPKVAGIYLNPNDGKLDFYALVLDTSQTGCRLVIPTGATLKEGAEFQVEIDGLARRRVQIIWTKELDGDVAKVGLAYL